MTNNQQSNSLRLDRRNFIKLAGGALAAAGTVHLFPAQQAQAAIINLHLAGTDGWFYIPGSVPTFLPDPLASAPMNIYGFGFRDVTNIAANNIINEKGKAQIASPIISVNVMDELYLKLT
ncbi:MAG: twin-arginine translocation signal domain-containing protein, partial [Anaerolineae bacterium]|nr:twin-arginine translocation signal domain-containing protein [Anaerolineae bacterium]